MINLCERSKLPHIWDDFQRGCHIWGDFDQILNGALLLTHDIRPKEPCCIKKLSAKVLSCMETFKKLFKEAWSRMETYKILCKDAWSCIEPQPTFKILQTPHGDV